MSCNPKLTIITPIYNRGSLLNKCYQSLVNQSSYDFEWVVVNDGSTDDTDEVIQGIMNQHSGFPIYYVKKENGGKHTALNAAHSYVHGSYVLTLDSDDCLVPNAVEIVLDGWSSYAGRSNITMLVYLRQNQDGKICAYVKEEGIPVDYLRCNRICVYSADCVEVIRVDLFLNYEFPVFKGERFLAETGLWYGAAMKGPVIYINKAVYVCEYLEGGLTKSGKLLQIKNPHGGMYTSYVRMDKKCRMKERLKAALLFSCYGKFAGLTVKEIMNKAAGHRFLETFFLVPGLWLHNYWKKKYLQD